MTKVNQSNASFENHYGTVGAHYRCRKCKV